MIDAVKVRELFVYDPETGILQWRKRRLGCSLRIEAGVVSQGHRRVCIDGKRYLIHRLIFLWMTGRYPKELIDHIDGDGTNNKWENLRECNKSENSQNLSPIPKSSSGLRGVAFCKQTGQWKARIKLNGKEYWLGRYTNLEDAYSAYLEAKRSFHEFQPFVRPLNAIEISKCSDK